MCKKTGDTWEMPSGAKVGLRIGIGLLVLALIAYFIGIPFFMATIGKRIWPNVDTKDVISILDGVATFVGVTGTCASVASIFMTLSDRSRYKEEKNQIESIKTTLDKVENTLSNVDTTLGDEQDALANVEKTLSNVQNVLEDVQKTANDISTENKQFLFKLVEEDIDKFTKNGAKKGVVLSLIRSGLNVFNNGPAHED